MLTCGTAVRSITPKWPLALAGYAARWGRVSEGVHDELYVKAFYFANGDVRMLLLFVDAEGLPQALTTPVEARIRRELGIGNVSFSATHTHSAPHTYPQVQLAQEEFDPAWADHLCDQLFGAAKDAMAQPFPASVGFASAAASEIARNRRAGHTITDPTLSLLAVADEAGTLRGALLTYACHCTVLDGTSYLVSADYPGYLCGVLEARFDRAVVAFSNGAAGDVNIGYSSDASALGEKMDIRTFANAKRVADILAQHALEALADVTFERDVAIDMRSCPLMLPLRPDLPTEADLRARIRALDTQIASCADAQQTRALQLQKIYQQCFLLRLHTNAAEGASLSAVSRLIRFGRRLYVTIPGELFTVPGLALKERLSEWFDPVLLCYSNGYVGYLPSHEAMLEPGYEAETSIFAPDVADALVSQITRAARALA